MLWLNVSWHDGDGHTQTHVLFTVGELHGVGVVQRSLTLKEALEKLSKNVSHECAMSERDSGYVCVRDKMRLGRYKSERKRERI